MNRNDFVAEGKAPAGKPKIAVSQVWNSDKVNFGFGHAICSVEVMYFNPFINKWGLKITGLKSLRQNSANVKFLKMVAFEMTEGEIHNSFEIETRQLRNVVDEEDEYEENDVLLANTVDTDDDDDTPRRRSGLGLYV